MGDPTERLRKRLHLLKTKPGKLTVAETQYIQYLEARLKVQEHSYGEAA